MDSGSSNKCLFALQFFLSFFSERKYEYVSEGRPFGEAEAYCNDRGGHLVTIQSKDFHDVFVREIRER